jgi:hypothetical protein
MESTRLYQRGLLRRFEQLRVSANNDPAKMGKDLLYCGFHRGTFQQGYENPEWLRTLLGMAAQTTPEIDRFLSYVEWRIDQEEMNRNMPKDADNEDCETRSSASNPTKKKVQTDKTVLTEPPTCSSIPTKKVPTVWTESEEEDDPHCAPNLIHAGPVSEMELRIMGRMDSLERDMNIQHSANSERFQNLELIHMVTNVRVHDMEKQLAKIMAKLELQ